MHRERTRRIPLRISVTVHPPQGREIQGWARNLSVSGIYVEAHRQVAVGTVCVLRMTLPQGQQKVDIRCEATVVRVDGTGMGFRFSHPHPDVVAELARQVVWMAAPARGRMRAG